MPTLLVPTDFSSASKNALSFASALATTLDAKITLLHALYVNPIDPGYINEKHKQDLDLHKKESEIKLKALCEDIEESSSGKCNFTIIEGLEKDVIVNYANEIKPELLVMGTENRNTIDRLVFGTITGKVIKEVTSTLLVVPENAIFKPPKKIAFAIDYHDSDLEEIHFVADLAKKFKSEVHIIHVVLNDENIDFEEQFFKDFKQEVQNAVGRKKIIFELIKGENVITELENYLNKESIDILAFAKAEKSFLERLFRGSVSQKLFYRIHIPLIVFKAKDTPGDLF